MKYISSASPKKKTPKCFQHFEAFEAVVMSAHHYCPMHRQSHVTTDAAQGSTVADQRYTLRGNNAQHRKDRPGPRIHPSPLRPHGNGLHPPALLAQPLKRSSSPVDVTEWPPPN